METVSVSTVQDASGEVVSGGQVFSSASLLETQGVGVVLVLAVPLTLAVIPLFGSNKPRRRILGIVSSVLMTVFCVLGLFSVGAFFAPCIVLLLVFAVFDREVVAQPALQ